jgi:predicted deacylase
MPRTVKISGIRVEQGTKKSAVLSVAEGPALTVNVPITIVSGSKPGKTLCLTAGVHGCEYAGIETAIRISKDINPKELSGTLIILPIINVPAFNSRTPYVCPIDHVNINRIFPGKLNGSISHVIAHTIFHNVIMKADYLIDLHGGDMVESLFPFTIFYKSGNKEIDEVSQDLARMFNMKYMLEARIKCEEYSPKGASYCEATRRGIPSIIAEAGEEGKLEEKYVSLLYKGVLNVMRYLGMIEGRHEIFVEPKILYQGTFLYAKRGGLFYSDVPVGSVVSKGDLLGEIRNLQGESLQKVTAPTECVILCKRVNPAVDVGSFLLMFAHLMPIKELANK